MRVDMATTDGVHTPHVLIRASAGSGKTFQLSNRYLQLLLAGAKPESILAVTFTRKAAGEIFDRIMERLAEAAGNGNKCRVLASFVSADLTPERCRRLLRDTVASLHRLRISTLDSYFIKVAGASALETGLPLHWRIVEPRMDQALRDTAIANALAGDSTAQILTLLHLLARGEVHRGVSQLVRGTVNDLYGTFQETTAAAWQSLQHVAPPAAAEVNAACQWLEQCTFSDRRFQKACADDLANFLAGNFDTFISKGLAARVAQGEEIYYNKPIGDDVLGHYAPLIAHARAFLINQLAGQTDATFQLLAHFERHYQQLKREHGALRFDDITHWLAKQSQVDDERTAFRLDGRLEHLLLDEFQDTSLAQWQVLRPLARRITAARTGKSFLCVGDTKQAIYGWRGGLAELFDTVAQELPGVAAQELAKSYRSSPVIIDVVNRVFSRMHRHEHLENLKKPIELWQRRFTEHSTDRTTYQGYATLETGPRVGDDENPTDRLLEHVADRVAQQYRQTPACSMGVLTRSNDKLRKLIYLLRQRDVPASEEGGNPLVDSAAVELILSVLQLADHPGDSAAWHHLLHSPLAGPLGIAGPHRRKAESVAARLRRELVDVGYGRAIENWSQHLAAASDARDRTRLQQLVELAYAWQPESTLRPRDFLEFVEETKVSDPTTSAVRVMTVHLAKGLEFDIVFLPELDVNLRGQTPSYVVSRPLPGEPIDCVLRYAPESLQQLLPERFQRMFPAAISDDVQEDLCVLYVALTRAIHALHMFILPPAENESRLPKKISGLLRAALCDDNSPRAGVLYAHGNPAWHEGKLTQQSEPAALAPTPPPVIALAPPEATRRRGLQRESPSQLEGGAAGQRDRLFAWHDAAKKMARDRGTALHACAELVHWLDEDRPQPRDLLAAIDRLREFTHVDDAQREMWVGEFLNAISNPNVSGVLSRSTYRATLPVEFARFIADADFEAQNEFPFATVIAGQVLQGRMDRVVLFQRGGNVIAADVIDFKTDALSDKPGQRMEDRVDYYRPQLAAYHQTLMQRFSLAPAHVAAGLLFLAKGELIRI